jgi:hypothetical protein
MAGRSDLPGEPGRYVETRLSVFENKGLPELSGVDLAERITGDAEVIPR